MRHAASPYQAIHVLHGVDYTQAILQPGNGCPSNGHRALKWEETIKNLYFTWKCAPILPYPFISIQP